MKQIQFNPHHRAALFCNSQNEKFYLLEVVQVGFNIYVYHSEQWDSTESVRNTQNAVIIKQCDTILKWFWYFPANTNTMPQK